MQSTIQIPKKIRVGYRLRSDTYTGKLAFIIYYDSSNKLRKEKSWEDWRNRRKDEYVETIDDYDNEPISGFVLNKKVGGYDTGWNHRQTYTRVYDPRGFEFEITVPNLLFILENTNSIKGKGLEGEFVYGWDGKDLVLVPVESPDYERIMDYSNKLAAPDKINKKNLILGATYRNRKNEEVVYMGYYDYYDYSGDLTGKRFVFRIGKMFEYVKTLNLIEVVNENPVSNYAELMEELECQTSYSPIDRDNFQWVEIPKDVVLQKLQEHSAVDCWFFEDGAYKNARVHRNRDNKCWVYSGYGYDYYTRRYLQSMAVSTNITERVKEMPVEEFAENFTIYHRVVFLKNGKKYRIQEY